MAKEKKEEKNKKEKQNGDFGHEIWGLIFMSIGVLVLISLISNLISPTNNILGFYLGTALSTGLNYYLGTILVFFVPVAIIFFGWKRLTGENIDYLSFVYAILIVLELSFLLSIHHLPEMAKNQELNVPYNNIGFFFVRMLRPIFGRHTFGPYFLIFLSLLVTILAVFHISPLQIILSIWEFTKKITEEIKASFRKWKDRRARLKIEETKETSTKEKSGVKKAKEEEEKKYVDEKAEDELEISDNKKGISEVEEEARLQLEKELAAFRARKNEPIKIMTIETQEIEEEEIDQEIPQYLLNNKEEERATGDFQTTTIKKTVPKKPYELPDPSIIPDPPPLASMVDKRSIEQNSMILEKTLLNFGIEGKVVSVSPGPVVTRYEIELAPGIKVSKVTSLHDDIAMAVGGLRIRIEAPIPGKSAVGIELPNAERQIVHFKHILMSDAFRKTKAKLPVIIGTNVSGAPYVTDVTKMPHVLIAGQTGSGKSVCINSIVCSLLMTMKPEELRLIMIDPKKVELAYYEGIPHLMSPVVTESKEAVKALQWGVAEMERRYRLMAKVGARNIDSFNSRVESGAVLEFLPEEDNKKLPFIVIIVDELADLMITASKDVEFLIQRIAQLARAVGIHLIVATQRPSVDIITGPIKANLTSRIAFRTIQSTDSRTILGHIGAEKLLGMGDMLFLRNGAPEIERFHGAFISEEDVEKIVRAIRSQNYEIDKIESFVDEELVGDEDIPLTEGERDELFEEAAKIIVSIGQGSTSLLQRRMKIGYARAGRLMDELERAGIVGPPDGSKAREVLITPDELDNVLANLR